MRSFRLPLTPSAVARAAIALIVPIAVTLAASIPAHAQQAAGRLPDRLSPETRAVIEQLADSLRTAGLPEGPLYSKAAEGVLKGASDARILQVVRSLAGELRTARAALRADADQAELVAGASALHAGLPADELRGLRSRQPRGGATSLAVPLTVLADLITRGVPSGAAAASVDALLARRVADSEFQALRVGVERDITAGQPPGTAARTWTRRILDDQRLTPTPPGIPPAAPKRIP